MSDEEVEWKLYPGFPSYEISSRAEVRRRGTGAEVKAVRMSGLRVAFESAFPGLEFPGTPASKPGKKKSAPKVMSQRDRAAIERHCRAIEKQLHEIRKLL